MPFSVETLHRLIIEWIVEGDQSINVVEAPRFRKLLLFLGSDRISDKDIPHRDKVTSTILKEYHLERLNMIEEMKNTLGRVSLTTDLWSDPNRDSYMGVTAHYMVRDAKTHRITYRDVLLAFRYVGGSHTGENLEKEFFKIIEEYGIEKKIGQVTMDNASNNNTLMEALERELLKRGIPFHRDGNRVRCFPHIINITVQAILEELKRRPTAPYGSSLPLEDVFTYVESLQKDPISLVRKVVATCRASGQRRRDLQETIKNGNKTGHWATSMIDVGREYTSMPEVQLLRDCETRWSSTFLMIDRFLVLFPAIKQYCSLPQNSDAMAHALLSEDDINVLQDIHQLLEIPHAAQELLSAERTPTLSMVFPVFELLIEQLNKAMKTLPKLSPFIEIAVSKLEEYMGQCRKTRIYALATVLNPSMKFDHMKKSGHVGEEARARSWMLEIETERGVDLVAFWHMYFQFKETIYPALFRVAMDVLPAQASSVACERVFSSSKETCTLRRSRIGANLLEALQVLKFRYKQDGLNFTEDLVAHEQDYSISGRVSERATQELLAAGRIDELEDLILNAETSCE
ncbi:hypothetical protein EUX98_g9474 [Antrodiella citrinella]|uniref:HAT C-terminal dimerisation domain-containing protein n=1 Tax=Antrodiella citrinella TaxID=2447956 RepID=A0A4S4LTM3_9APHY|nr:hypothetical protein EUX98_g9474 [Antrodiella citrinella]